MGRGVASAGLVVNVYFLYLLFQLPEYPRRVGSACTVQVLVLALVDGLLQPVLRSEVVLRQAVGAFEERPAKIVRADVRSELRRLGRI